MVKGIYPGFIEFKFNYINIGGVYESVLMVTDYMTEIQMLDIMDIFMNTGEIDISFHIKRKNNAEFLKYLTKTIAEYGAETTSVSKNQIDINVLNNIKRQASILRRKIQIDGQQIYMVSTYIVVRAKSEEVLLKKIRDITNKLYSYNIIVKTCNFRQRQAYLGTIPLIEEVSDLSKSAEIIMTENAVSNMFPFYTRSFLQNNGIVLGRINKDICLIDIFSPKNNNYNMCVFGSSGSGKSYFVKLNIIRNAYKGIKQIIVDPEGEYVNLVKGLGGVIYTEQNYNPLIIYECFANNNEDFFDRKIQNVVNYCIQRYNIKDIEKLKEIVKELYNKYGITKEKKSLYVKGDSTKFFANPRYKRSFPSLKELEENLNSNALKLLRKFNYEKEGEILETANIYCINLKNKTQREINKLMKIFIPAIYELFDNETIIYFDEVWKCIGNVKNRYPIENIYNMFKTLRKTKAGVAIISQDINDLFNIDEGRFGKSILNNSNMKLFFKTEWSDSELLNKMGVESETLDKIQKLDRAQAYIKMANTNFILNVEATKYEHLLIEGEMK